LFNYIFLYLRFYIATLQPKISYNCSKLARFLDLRRSNARGIVAEPPKGMSEAKCLKVMERIARRERAPKVQSEAARQNKLKIKN
jgi:hypothetical protein